MLLSRVADRIYWGGRYMERAEDTARIVRAHAEMIADLPAQALVQWEPLVAIMGSGTRYTETVDLRLEQQQQGQLQSQFQSQSQSLHGAPPRASNEYPVVSFLVADRHNPGSVTRCVFAARENLRTTRDTIPRDGWATLNDLYLYVNAEADRSADRRLRDRFLTRVIADSRRLDGVLATAMTHDEAYVMWRLGRAIERSDMTTRVLGVRAADVLSRRSTGATGATGHHDEVQWMGVLRSLSGLQMYQRAVRGPIEGPKVVQFLLEHDRFPRAVRALLREIRNALGSLPDPGAVLDAVDRVDAVVRDSSAATDDGEELDDAMDAVQVAISQLDRHITERYLRVGS
ncbi:MAG: alpha-E domain-containing protein [Actinomycetota bacterium]|nr:alpha-E domain-containing protein [Actinomycetota bacterium]